MAKLTFLRFPIYVLCLDLEAADEELGEGTLSKLPKDEYQLVLGFLSPEDKLNLKLASKACEKRVMALNPTMRRWNIKLEFYDGSDLNSGSNLQMYLDLTKAKAKHSEYGHIADIEMNVIYRNYSSTPILGAIFADNIINHWKNNIVKLDFELTGHEMFLSDPTLNLPSLKKLQIHQYGPTEADKTKANSIAFALLVNQSKSIEDLKLRCINLEIKDKIQINKLTLEGVTQSTLVSVLNCSNESLECLELERIRFSF